MFAEMVLARCRVRQCRVLVVRDTSYGFAAHYEGSRGFMTVGPNVIGTYDGKATVKQLTDDVRPYWGGGGR